MASMITYFSIAGNGILNQPSSTCCWDGHASIGENLTNVRCPYQQLRFLLEQSIAAAYYVKFYGTRCHEVINEYIDELNNDIMYRFERMCGKEFKDNYLKIYNILQNISKFNRGGKWTDIDLGLVDEFLFDGGARIDVPTLCGCNCKVARGIIMPFLIWMNKSMIGPYTKFVNDPIGIASIHQTLALNGSGVECNLVVHNIGDGYYGETSDIGLISSIPLLDYLSHFSLVGQQLETLMGIISEFCIHTDIERYGTSISHHLAYAIRQGLFNHQPDVTGDHDGTNPVVSIYHSQLFETFLAFVDYCTKNRGLELADRKLIARAFNYMAYTKQQKESVAYLYDNNATAATDAIESFKQIMGSVESLQLISQNPTLMAAQTDNQVASSTEAKDDDTKSEGEKKEPEKAESKPYEEPEEPKESKEDDDSKPDEGDDGDDNLDTDDDSSGTEFNPDGIGDGDDTGGSSDPGTDGSDTGTQTGSAPDNISTSDEKGIEITITPPEMATVDSVLYREEMYKFITNVLTNPPKCMSPQDIATLKALKKFWLSCLSIETIKGIIEACIRLPQSIKLSIHKSTELSQ